MPTKVLGVLGGNDLDGDLLSAWANGADLVVAADGGANRLAASKLPFRTVVGDMDSADSLALEGKEVVLIPDQGTTDADKLLAYFLGLGVTAVTLTGVEGDLPDHVLGILHSCLRSPLRIRLAYRKGIGYVLRPGDDLVLDCTGGTRLSFLPLLPSAAVRLSGAEWPLDETPLHPAGATSISNRASCSPVRASLASGAALLFVGYARSEMPRWGEF